MGGREAGGVGGLLRLFCGRIMKGGSRTTTDWRKERKTGKQEYVKEEDEKEVEEHEEDKVEEMI